VLIGLEEIFKTTTAQLFASSGLRTEENKFLSSGTRIKPYTFNHTRMIFRNKNRWIVIIRVTDQGGGLRGTSPTPPPPQIKNIFGFLGNSIILSAEFLKISRKILAETHFFSFYSQLFWQKVEKTLSVNRILQKVDVLDIFGSISARKSDEILSAKMFGLFAEFLAPLLFKTIGNHAHYDITSGVFVEVLVASAARCRVFFLLKMARMVVPADLKIPLACDRSLAFKGKRKGNILLREEARHLRNIARSELKRLQQKKTFLRI
jgi:hypothetical protein